MGVLEQLTESLKQSVELSTDQAVSAATALASAEVEPGSKAEFLKALAAKGETATEVAAFAETMRGLAINPGMEAWASEAIDIVGTGGDHAGSFNISSTVSFILAASGVPVFKHGNRSITSKCGSADIIEGVGVRLDAPHALLRKSVEALNFCFFFAPAFHPAFKEIMPVRKALAAEGQRTIFNILGPLINPGKPANELLGVYAGQWVEPLAGALTTLGLNSGLVVHGQAAEGVALDELSCAGVNHVAGVGQLAEVAGELRAADAGLAECDFSALKGGDVTENLTILSDLAGANLNRVPSGLVDTILMNAGAALWVAGRADNLKSGVQQASDTLRGGCLASWLKQVAEFYADHALVD
ncbi:MAG: anthranilate phosphoribosyltransferase [Verrucomicrobiota bacterium]